MYYPDHNIYNCKFKKVAGIYDLLIEQLKFKQQIDFPVFIKPRDIKVKVEHYLLFMFSPPKISLTV